jgi:hypothetical protein
MIKFGNPFIETNDGFNIDKERFLDYQKCINL